MNPVAESSTTTTTTKRPAPSEETLHRKVSQSYSYDTHTDEEDRSRANALWDKIDEEEWEAVIEHISDFPQLAKSRNRVPNSIQFNLPLHEVCRRQPPLQVVNLLLAFYDEAVHTPGQYGFLPLHVACGTGASYDVVTRLIDAYPAATRCRDDVKDALPLHLAAQWGASEEVLLEILTTHPEGSFIRDAAGKTPLDHAKALPESDVKQYAISALARAPILVATSKSAAVRVEREMESRLRGVQNAHQEFIRQMEQRHEDEKTEFLQMEVGFHNDLAAEKERNCELAEVILRLQKREWKEAEERKALQERLEEQVLEFKTRCERQQKDLKDVLERASITFPKSEDKASDGLQEGSNDQQSDGNGADDVSRAIQPNLSTSSEPASPIVLNQVSHLVQRYTESEKELKKTSEELQNREAMVTKLNELVQKKDQEIQSLTSQLKDAQSQNEAANSDLRKMGLLHKEAVQELYSFKNEMNRLKRRSETQTQQLQETWRKLELRDKRMEKVKGLVASLSLNVDRWHLDPEESHLQSLDDSTELQEVKESALTESTEKANGEAVPEIKKEILCDTEKTQNISFISAAESEMTNEEALPEINQKMEDDTERIQNISAITLDQNECFTWTLPKNHREVLVSFSNEDGNEDEDEGLEVSVVESEKILNNKLSEDSNETATTTKAADDEAEEENLSFISQPYGIRSIRPIDSDLI